MVTEAKPGSELFNGSSLTRLTGAATKARVEVEVHLPASSLAEAIQMISTLGRTGNLTINFARGHAMDLKWKTGRETRAPEDMA